MNFYLNKYGFLAPQLTTTPSSELEIIVVIPCFNEPDLLTSLQSLDNCIMPHCHVEVIIVVNSSEDDDIEIKEQNLKTIAEFNTWKSLRKGLDFLLIHQDSLPEKHAGVGLARKIGMDEAVSRFDRLERNGIIVCFDADARCESNYLVEILRHFQDHPKSPACSISFEHPIAGDEFDDQIYAGIINYELHLRYYNQCLVYCNLPYAYHTVGSSMAVRSSAYQKQGGMNKRKAGEDFYFIHKMIALGNFSELKSTKVIPSPRVSDRVPFGTGKAIGAWIKNQDVIYSTYNFETFKSIKRFLIRIPEFYEGNFTYDSLSSTPRLNQFLEQHQFLETLSEIRSNTKNFPSFRKRFFVWFDAFRVLKLVHYFQNTDYPNQEIGSACSQLLEEIVPFTAENDDRETLLHIFRRVEIP